MKNHHVQTFFKKNTADEKIKWTKYRKKRTKYIIQGDPVPEPDANVLKIGLTPHGLSNNSKLQ